MAESIQLGSAEEVRNVSQSPSRRFSILVKREPTVANLWHSLIEMFSLSMTLDVLRSTRDPATNASFLDTADVASSRVVILDDHEDGPFYDLWTLFARRPTVRWANLSADTVLDKENIVIPLPGGSNPFWQGDWKVHSCEQSELLRVFSQRVLGFYQLEADAQADDRPLTLVFIDRRGTRRLMEKGRYFSILKSKFPALNVEVVDFAELSMLEQLQLVRRTDILVGVHGAGLTHGMFLQPGSTMVEILPRELNYKGFRNLAKLLGHHYYSSHAAGPPARLMRREWHFDDVSIEEDRFLNLLEVAVKSMYNRGLRKDDAA